MRTLHPTSALLALVPVLLPACTSNTEAAGHTSAPAAPTECFVDYQGGKLHYFDAGHGDAAIVLVHGWASDHRAWGQQFPGWSDDYRVLVVELPGHGQSTKPRDGYSMAAFADSIAAVLDDAQIESAVLIGHSNGTPVIRKFHDRYPDRTLGLIALDGALKQVVSKEDAQRMFSMFSEATWTDTMSAMVTGMPAVQLSDADRAHLLDMATSQKWSAVEGGFVAATAADAHGQGTIDVPLLALMVPSPFWSEDYEESIKQMAPQAEFLWVQESGHYIQYERPKFLRRSVDEFIRRWELLD